MITEVGYNWVYLNRMKQGNGRRVGLNSEKRLMMVEVNLSKCSLHNLELKTGNWSRRSEATDSKSYRSEEVPECEVSRVVLRRHLTSTLMVR